MLAEDNDLNAEIAVTFMENVGMLVDRVVDGRKCIDSLCEHEAGYYDVILMDIQMPVMDGYEATKAVRQLEDKDLAGIPIVAMTANAFDEDRKAAFAVGMNGHIAKPMNLEKLKEALADVI